MSIKFTSTLQKLRMPQIRGFKGEAVVIYCEPLTTKEMGYHRLSHGVNNTVKNIPFWISLTVEFSILAINEHNAMFKRFYTNLIVLFMQV